MRKKLFFLTIMSVLLIAVMAFSVGIKAAIAEDNATVTSAPAVAEGSPAKFDARAALLMDFGTMTVLYEQCSRQRLQIASMTKIMTLLLIYQEIDKETLSFDTDIVVSANAASMGGSQAFLDANSVYKAGELIKSIVVASANDSCVALAEHISGDVASFVFRMNQKASELELVDTSFANCTGLPAENHYSSAYDIAVMSKHLMSNPLFFQHSKIWMYDFVHAGGRVTGLTNTNKLVRFYEGCDGGKTGFTKEALSCLSATAKRGDTRLISVIIGAPTAKIRNAEVSRMLNYGFANFENRQLVFGGVQLEEPLSVENGKTKHIQAVPSEDFFVLVKKSAPQNTETQKIFNELSAPIKQGEVVGKILIKQEGEIIGEVDLLSATAVAKLSYLDLLDRLVEGW